MKLFLAISLLGFSFFSTASAIVVPAPSTSLSKTADAAAPTLKSPFKRADDVIEALKEENDSVFRYLFMSMSMPTCKK